VGWFHHLAEKFSRIPSIIIELICGFAIGSITTLALIFFQYFKKVLTEKK
jgi:hypothetical protein